MYQERGNICVYESLHSAKCSVEVLILIAHRHVANIPYILTCLQRHHRIMMSSYVLYRLLIEPPGGDSRPQRFCWLDSRPRARRLASRARRALLVEGLWQEWTEPSTANALRLANFLNLSLHLRRGGGVVEELRAAVTGAFRLISISKL